MYSCFAIPFFPPYTDWEGGDNHAEPTAVQDSRLVPKQTERPSRWQVLPDLGQSAGAQTERGSRETQENPCSQRAQALLGVSDLACLGIFYGIAFRILWGLNTKWRRLVVTIFRLHLKYCWIHSCALFPSQCPCAWSAHKDDRKKRSYCGCVQKEVVNCFEMCLVVRLGG